MKQSKKWFFFLANLSGEDFRLPEGKINSQTLQYLSCCEIFKGVGGGGVRGAPEQQDWVRKTSPSLNVVKIYLVLILKTFLYDVYLM